MHNLVEPTSKTFNAIMIGHLGSSNTEKETLNPLKIIVLNLDGEEGLQRFWVSGKDLKHLSKWDSYSFFRRKVELATEEGQEWKCDQLAEPIYAHTT